MEGEHVVWILRCRPCQARSWTMDDEMPPEGSDACEHEWWSVWEFRVRGNGDGLAPTLLASLPTVRKLDSETAGR